MIKIFLATPMSGFGDAKMYSEYREKMMSFISILKNEFDVYSEIEKIINSDCYDSPEKSVSEDFGMIDSSDVFVIHHPKPMQTSTFIELGYAFAKNKTIIIIANSQKLPYLMRGMTNSFSRVFIINDSDINKNVAARVAEIIKAL